MTRLSQAFPSFAIWISTDARPLALFQSWTFLSVVRFLRVDTAQVLRSVRCANLRALNPAPPFQPGLPRFFGKFQGGHTMGGPG